MKFHSKKFNILMVLELLDVYQYHSPQKNSLESSTHKLNFEVYMKKCKKHIFQMKFHSKTLNFLTVLKLLDVYQFHSP